MVQASLDDKDVLAAIGEREFTAIADGAFCWAAILRNQTRRKIHAFEMFETELIKRVQSISTTAKKFDDLGVARPFAGAQTIEPGDKFLDFLFGRFKTEIGGFPWIRSQRVLRLSSALVFGRLEL